MVYLFNYSASRYFPSVTLYFVHIAQEMLNLLSVVNTTPVCLRVPWVVDEFVLTGC